jgi:putative transposase
MGRSRYKTFGDYPTYFATCSTLNWLPLFNKPELAHILLDAMRFAHENGRLVLHAYVLMEDHFHLVGSALEFPDEMRNFKSYTARRIVDSLQERGFGNILKQLRFLTKRHKQNQTYQVWQEGFHPEAIQNEAMLRQKIEYIHNNPVRRGFVDEASHWRYSSARQYEGSEGLVPVEILA